MLNFVQKKLIFLIIFVIVAGLLNVKFFGGYKFTPLICLVAAVIMIYPSLVPLSFSRIAEIKKYYNLLFLSIVLNFVFVPFVAYFLGASLLTDEPVLRLGFMVLALLPGGGMVTTWALKSRANMVTTVGIIMVNLLLAIIIVPFGISSVMKNLNLDISDGINKESIQFQLSEKYNDQNNIFSTQDIAVKEKTDSCVVEKTTRGVASCDFGGEGITPLKIAIPIIFIVFLPLLLALLTQKIILKFKGEKYFNKIKNKFGAFSNVGLLIILFMLMSLESNATIFEQANLVFETTVVLILFYTIIFLVPYFLYKKYYHNSQGKALIWGSYLRYITLALGLAISLVYQDESLMPIILVIVLSYLIQMPASYWIAKKL